MDTEQEIAKPSAIIVAHPDDETLWAGGFVLSHPERKWTIVTLCRGSDPDRAPKFYRVLERYQASGKMGDLDDEPGQKPLPARSVTTTILDLLPNREYLLIITHHPLGEYTRHLRHEETSHAVAQLWMDGKIHTEQFWTFAYEDQERKVLPYVQPGADLIQPLSDSVWREKYNIITKLYGFAPESWEARATPRIEGFWCFKDPELYKTWALTRRSTT